MFKISCSEALYTGKSVEIITRDDQSNPNRAAKVAANLVRRDKVNIIVAASPPDTINPVTDQTEINEYLAMVWNYFQ